MSTTWIRDKVVAVAEAQAEETGEDANEIIWQLSKELGRMAQVSGPRRTDVPIVSDEKFKKELKEVTEEYPDLPSSDREWSHSARSVNVDVNPIGVADVSEHVERIKKSLDNIDASKIAPAFDKAKKSINSIDVSKIGPTLNRVKRPAHYAEGRQYEPKDVIRDWGLNFNVGSAVKYCSRLDRKDDDIEQLDKAITFLQFEREARLKERGHGSQD